MADEKNKRRSDLQSGNAIAIGLPFDTGIGMALENTAIGVAIASTLGNYKRKK